MKVLGVVGGARREGNTSRLVEEVLNGAREAGHEIILFRLADMDIRHWAARAVRRPSQTMTSAR